MNMAEKLYEKVIQLHGYENLREYLGKELGQTLYDVVNEMKKIGDMKSKALAKQHSPASTPNQQLKAEILPLLADALEEFAERKFEHGKHYLEQAMAKLSAV